MQRLLHLVLGGAVMGGATWFGASESQLDTVLPNLVNFGTARKLAFL